MGGCDDNGCISANVFGVSMRNTDFAGCLRVDWIIGTDHFLHREVPHQFNDLLVRWLRGH